MRSLISTARNIQHSITKTDDSEEKLQTTIEAVLTVMTRRMAFSGSGIFHTEDLETMRFEMTISAAEGFIKHLQEWVDSAEDERAKLALRTST